MSKLTLSSMISGFLTLFLSAALFIVMPSLAFAQNAIGGGRRSPWNYN